MAQNFRSALNGFNREDVVQYLDYLNKRHTAQISELTAQVGLLQQKLDSDAQPEPQDEVQIESAEALSAKNQELAAQLAEMQKQLDDLRRENETLRARPIQSADTSPAQRELEAYRRAERTERLARERADQIFRQANGVLADATVRVDEAAEQVGGVVDQVMKQLGVLQAAVGSSRQALQDAASAMYGIHNDD